MTTLVNPEPSLQDAQSDGCEACSPSEKIEDPLSNVVHDPAVHKHIMPCPIALVFWILMYVALLMQVTEMPS